MNKENFLCGVIEGYYGRPWTFDQRKRLFQYCLRFGLNSYVYAPKDDDKHRSRWREFYSDHQLKELKSLIDQCQENDLKFIYALSPGLDIKYSAEEDFQHLYNKFHQLSSIGCEHWALLFDDIENEMSKEDQEKYSTFANAQVQISNRLFQSLHQPKIFLFCPTEYCSRMGQPSLEKSSYLQTIGDGLHPNIQIFWTGPKVVSRRLTLKHLNDVRRILKRRVTIWENLNANDYDQRRLCLGPFSDRPTNIYEELNGMLINPNCEFEVNFIPLNSLGQWFQSIQSYLKSNPNATSIPNDLYNVDQALDRALNDWLPLFNQSDSNEIDEKDLSPVNELTLDEIKFLVEYFYLPYQNGKRAQELFNEFYWLRFYFHHEDKRIEWNERSILYEENVKKLQKLYEKLISMKNRSLLYDLYSYLQDMNSTISLSSTFIQWLKKNENSGSSIFMSGDVEPWCIRGGLTGDFLNLLPLGDFQSSMKANEYSSGNLYLIRPLTIDDQKLISHLSLKVANQDGLKDFHGKNVESDVDRFLSSFRFNETSNIDGSFIVENNQEQICAFLLTKTNLQEFDQNCFQSINYPQWIDDQYPVRIQLMVDLTLKSEEIYYITSKLMKILQNYLRKKNVKGCHLLIDERMKLLRQCFYRLGFLDIPNVDENDQIILLAKEF